MNGIVKNYKIKLTTLAPVHIGSGEKLNKKEYVIFDSEKKIYILDRYKLIKEICNRRLDNDFEEFMLLSNDSLHNWLNAHNFTEQQIKSLSMYSIDCSKTIDKIDRRTEIIEYIKDAYCLPYIPGSSIKGAIRTALMNYDIISNPSKYSMLKREIINCSPIDKNKNKPNTKYLSFEGNKIEKITFNTLNLSDNVNDAKNDILKGIVISDSTPLKLDDMILCRKIDLSVNKRKLEINTMRECIKPGITIEFDIQIDSSVCNISANTIMEALSANYKFYNEVFISYFTSSGSKSNANIYIGGGSGFGTKTALYAILDNHNRVKIASNLMHIKFKNHFHNKDTIVSPHMLKCTFYNGKLCEIGKCRLDIIEI